MPLKYAVNDVDILTNCVAWYPCNEESSGAGAVTRYDAHGTFDLTDTNTTPSTTGNWNRAASTTLANSEKLTISNDLGITGGAITISAWIKLPAEITTGSFGFITQGDAGVDVNYTMGYEYNGGTPRIFFNRQRQNTSNNVINHTVSLGTTWHHLVLTYNGTTLEGYLDNVSVGTLSTSGNGASAGVDAFVIGQDSSGYLGSGYSTAYYQDVSVYNTALTTTQISRLYNSGLGMTYGVDFGGSFVNSTTGTSLTVSSVTAAGTNTVGLVYIKEINGASEVCTGITWDGVAMTKIASQRINNAERWTSLWYLANPTATSSSVTVSLSTSTFCRASVTYYVGVNQTTPIDASGTNTASAATTFNTSLTSVANYCWHVMGSANDTGNQAAGTSTLLRGTASDSNILDSNSAKTPAGSVTLQATGASAGWGSVIASLKPVSESTTTIKTWNGIARANIKTLNGVTSANLKTINGIT
jgi:hypothetical protein